MVVAMSEDTADGRAETRADGKTVVRFERRLAHPVSRVWAALTASDELVGWWGDADVELVEGGRFEMRWLNTDDAGEHFVMHATITRLEPPHVLETDGDVHGTLRWELREHEGGTLLSFTSVLDLPEEMRTKVLAGWHFHLDALETVLGGGAVDIAGVPGWERLHDRYVAQPG